MMVIDWFYTLHAVRQWKLEEHGTAVVEAAVLFPPMITLMMGVFDLGNGIVLSQKTITSSQVAADLVSRNRTIDAASVEEVINAARLAFEPYGINQFGIDIASVEFDALQQPVILWRETRDMAPNAEAVQSLSGLAPEGEGMIVVTVQYAYVPHFSRFFTGDLNLREVAFARGRRSATVTWE
jgi:Flp pilus assembly protein TadG